MNNDLEIVQKFIKDSKEARVFDKVDIRTSGVYIRLGIYSSTHAIGNKNDPQNCWFLSETEALKQALKEFKEYFKID